MGEKSVGIDTRYWFTPQLLQGAALQSRMAFGIEARETVTERDRVAHRSFVLAAIMQSVSALEAEIWDVVHYGPEHQLASENMDARFAPIVQALDRRGTLSGYTAVLRLMDKEPLDTGAQTWQDADLLVWLRNEIVHYDSSRAAEPELAGRMAALASKNLPKPPFMPDNVAAWFPNGCLSASCAAWAVDTTVTFLDTFYTRLGSPSPVDWCRDALGDSLSPRR